MRKRVAAISVIGCLVLYLGSIAYYYAMTPAKKIAKTAFTIGSWDACEAGPSLINRHMASISHAYFYLPGRIQSFHNSGRTLIHDSVGNTMCWPDHAWAVLDNVRIKRGIDLGIKSGESIDSRTGGVAPIHIATRVQNAEILEHILENGADVNLKTQSRSLYGSELNALQIAEEMQRDKLTGFQMEKVINILRIYGGTSPNE